MKSKAYAKCIEPGCGLIVYSFDEYKDHRVQTGHHLDQTFADSVIDSPWKGVCCKACWFAKRRPCRCKCRRANHQRGVQKLIEDFKETPSRAPTPQEVEVVERLFPELKGNVTSIIDMERTPQ